MFLFELSRLISVLSSPGHLLNYETFRGIFREFNRHFKDSDIPDDKILTKTSIESRKYNLHFLKIAGKGNKKENY